MSEQYKSNNNYEDEDSGYENKERLVEERQPTIEELLPRYYEAYGENGKYETIRSMPIAGHDVAWMSYSGEIEYDMMGQGREGQHFCVNTLVCACKFEEGVGWGVSKDGRPHGIYGAEENCLPKKAAIYLRQQELRSEYVNRFKDEDMFASQSTGLSKEEHIEAVMLDLIEKDKAGEFICEDGSGAHFWGGHFYMQTVMAITNAEPKKVWAVVDKMRKNKQIDLEGMVVQTYNEPPEPSWDEYRTYNFDRITIVACVPAHSKMPQQWRYKVTVTDKDGQEVTGELSGLMLTHESAFGIDGEDVAIAEADINALVRALKEKGKELSLTQTELIERDAGGDTDVE